MSGPKGVSLWLTALLEKEFEVYCGVDEVGLGCFAGPVFAGAVVIENHLWPEVDMLRDSKTLGPRKRAFLAKRIQEECNWAIGRAEVTEIDEFGLRVAHIKAIERAVDALKDKGVPFPAVVIDGDAFDIDLGDMPIRFIRRGDDLIPAISAASIIAKVTRDAHMTELAKDYPHYGWDRNAAYGTPEHQAAMKKYGLTPHHRRSVKPVGKLAAAQNDCCDGKRPACCFLYNTKGKDQR